MVAEAAITRSGLVDDQQARLLPKLRQRLVQVRGVAITFRQHGRDVVEIVDHIRSGADRRDSEEIGIPPDHPQPRQPYDAALFRMVAGKPYGEIQRLRAAGDKKDMAQPFGREFGRLRAQNLFRF